MRKLIAALAALAAVVTVSSCGKGRTKAARLLENYAVVTIPAPDLSGISDNGKEVLNLYKFAADQADAIYWKQNFGPKSTFDDISDPAAKEFAYVNYGPWDRTDGKPFMDGYGPRPLGAGFYPKDMTSDEFNALRDPDKNSPYTLITRDSSGNLDAVWYHDAYKDEVERIAHLLKAAADITIKESVRNYLLEMANAVLTDNYYAAERAWLQMTDSKMDLVLGPNETIDDDLYGIKASYGAYVLLKNEDRTRSLQEICNSIPEYQAMLPGDVIYHAFEPGSASNIFSCNVIYYGGYPNAGYKNIAINFPYDAKAQEEFGTRTILFDNIIREKFNRTVFPVGMQLFEGDDRAHLDANAFWWEIVFREVAKGLGVKETINGKGSVEKALGNEALTIEKAKSNVIGTWLCAKLVDDNRIDALIMRNDVLATFIANTIRSTRFGWADATGRANLIIYNYLTEQGAIERKVSGKYKIDYDKTYEALETLGAAILKIQANGDYDAAVTFAGNYGFVPQAIQQDVVNLELEKIPVDIRFEYEK